MKRFTTFCLISICGVMPALSMNNFESVPPGNWAKVESLSQGEEVSVKMFFGDKMNGEYVSLDLDAIRLKIDGEEKVYPRKDIAEICLLNVNDSNLNGVGIGVLIGAAAMGIWGGIAARGVTSEAGTAALALAGAGIGGGIGGLIGYVWDNQHKGTELIYRAPNNK